VVVPKPKSITSKEITVKFSLKKLVWPGLSIVALAILAVILWRAFVTKKAPPVPEKSPAKISGLAESINSIAVLPFKNLSPEQGQDYFCDGMTDELISKLSRVQSLRVISRNSVFTFKDTPKKTKAIAQELQVRNILDGSVRKAGNRLRINVQLIDAETDAPIWSDTYDKDLENIFDIQDAVAQAIVKALKIELLGVNENQLVKHYTENTEAYNLYLQGRYFFNKRTEEDLKKSSQYFERAIAMDPKFALAYSGLADYYLNVPDYSTSPPKNAYQEGKKVALRAVELDDGLAEAHTSLGLAYAFHWEWKNAETECKKAITLNPNYSQAHHWHGMLLTYQARHDDAIAEIKRALDMDPYSLVINRNLGSAYCYARRYDEALEQLKKTVEMDPDFSWTNFLIGLIFREKNMFQEAGQAFRKETMLPDSVKEGFVYSLYARTGEREKARSYLEQNARMLAMVPPYWAASIYAELRETDKAFEWLEKAYEMRDGWIRYLKVSSEFDYLHSDPRYKALLKKIGLE